MKLSLSDILNATQGTLQEGQSAKNPKEIFFTRLSTDTRSLKSGELFLALRGENFDGNQFAKDAAKKGAECLILEKQYQKEIDSIPNYCHPIIWVSDGLEALGSIAHFLAKKI